MNTTENTDTTRGIESTKGEKIAGWLILAMVAYLFIAG